ncbi:VOC family protein [Streptosporangiaceae bacterium NEAU-GS5]|nr:VOC family protein [Streptosporangiaceae bacterium NEAU-GS5]
MSMSITHGMAHGTPCWVDLGSPDLGAASDFYGALFGWHFEETEEGYLQARLGGAPVAGIGAVGPDDLPWWTTYIAVDDAHASVSAAVAAGGELVTGPQWVGEQGISAYLKDPAGASLAIWQAESFAGSQVLGRPGASCWYELAVRDPLRAQRFYQAVFGWDGVTRSVADATSAYTDFGRHGETVAGMIRMNEMWPDEIPAHWMVYFAVDDCDAAASDVTSLGGVVSIAPFDIAPGRVSVVNDPHGAVFSLIRLSA